MRFSPLNPTRRVPEAIGWHSGFRHFARDPGLAYRHPIVTVLHMVLGVSPTEPLAEDDRGRDVVTAVAMPVAALVLPGSVCGG